MSSGLVRLSDVPFDAANLLDVLERHTADVERYDELNFGLIMMRPNGDVVGYNRVESVSAGLTADRVLGLNFFTDVAPCTNNYMVAGRYEEDEPVDETIDYVFTLRMKPTHVRLRTPEGRPKQVSISCSAMGVRRLRTPRWRTTPCCASKRNC